MNEVIVNPNEIESVWEKDKLCFVKMNSGKVWLCEEFIKIGNDIKFPTKKFIKNTTDKLICLPLSKKGKSE